ncbi:MAG: peptide deformylase [Bacillota bacterium]|jgi:peptide deformylase|nr:peptide deformylase [Bacillota bacterium]NLV70061.1 peptide deformylase [Clostridiales bacterium]HPF18655.1 peptide deformylase [Bacillota bacterium]
MALRNIVTEGDDVLRKHAREVLEINDRIRDITEDMVQTMRAEHGLGLAAPQVGILRRIIVIEMDGQLYRLINPEIVETRGEQFEEEGCLSVPGMIGRVRRPQYVRIKGFSPEGNPVEYEGEGLLAVAFCHECDHLDGILFIDKAEQIHSADQAAEDEE